MALAFKPTVVGGVTRWHAFQDPDDRLDYLIQFDDAESSWLETDTILSVAWEVEAGLDEDGTSNTTTTATIWLQGGTVGEDYLVTCTVTTAAGRVLERSFTLKIRDR